MKTFLFSLVLSVLAGCNGTDTNQDTATNEIWKLYMQTDAFDVATDEFVETTRRENKFIFIKNNDGQVTYHECDQARKMTGEITESGIRIWDTELLKVSENVYQNEVDRFESNQDYYYNTIATLRKIQKGAQLDLGELVIEGPISLSETNSVCSFNSYVPGLNWKSLGLRVPYFDRYLQFDLVYTDQLSIGSYDWNKNDQDSPIVTVGVISSSEEFYSTTGTNGLVPDEAHIEITKISDNAIKGSVTFNELGGQLFSIEFAAELLALEP